MPDKKLTDNEIIEALEEWIKNYEGTYGNFKTLGNALDLITRQQAEIERLTANIKTLENIIKNSFLEKAGLNIDPLAEIKSEAVKEFAERLEKKSVYSGLVNADIVYKVDIYNLVKEMVGEKR